MRSKWNDECLGAVRLLSKSAKDITFSTASLYVNSAGNCFIAVF